MEKENERIELWNCREFRPRWPKKLWAKEVIFIDGKGREAKDIVERMGMKTLMVTKSFESTKNPKYIVNYAEYRNHEDALFKLSMHELIKYSDLFGYSDYEEFCKRIIPAICGEKVME